MKSLGLLLLAAAILQPAQVASLDMCIPWGCNPDCIKGLGSVGDHGFKYYHHWQDSEVHDLDQLNMEFIPSFWGPAKMDQWQQVKKNIKGNNRRILFINEPDVASQSVMGPSAAAALFRKEMQPLAEQGHTVSTPQICFDLDWLHKFMEACHDCKIGAVAAHWYGSINKFQDLQKYILSLHEMFPNLKIWLTEYGITANGGGSVSEALEFHQKAVGWLKGLGYVEVACWLGGFLRHDPPDAYPNPNMAYFVGDGHPSQLLWWAAEAGKETANDGLPGPLKVNVGKPTHPRTVPASEGGNGPPTYPPATHDDGGTNSNSSQGPHKKHKKKHHHHHHHKHAQNQCKRDSEELEDDDAVNVEVLDNDDAGVENPKLVHFEERDLTDCDMLCELRNRSVEQWMNKMKPQLSKRDDQPDSDEKHGPRNRRPNQSKSHPSQAPECLLIPKHVNADPSIKSELLSCFSKAGIHPRVKKLTN